MEKEDKIDKLARAVKMGFDRVDEQFKHVDEQFKDVRVDMANLRSEIKGEMANLRTDFDIMLDRHIGTFRKDYDELSARVKRIEEHIFK